MADWIQVYLYGLPLTAWIIAAARVADMRRYEEQRRRGLTSTFRTFSKTSIVVIPLLWPLTLIFAAVAVCRIVPKAAANAVLDLLGDNLAA